MTYSFAPSNDPLFVAEGDLVQFQFQAPLTWNTTETITIQIGNLTQFWYITTIPEDFTPDPFPFQAIPGNPGAELDTLYTYGDGTRVGEEIVVVSGLTPTTQASVYIASNISGGIDTYAMRIDYDGDGTWDTGWFQPTSLSAISVENGARIQIRGKSSVFSNDITRITVVIGTSSEVWTIQTKTIPLNEPYPFPEFPTVPGLDKNEVAYSDVVQITGLTTDAIVSLSNSNSTYGISNTNDTFVNADGYDVLTGVDFDNPPLTVSNDQYLQLRMTASSIANTPEITSVGIGDIIGGSSWTIITGSNPSETPDSFSFDDEPSVQEDTLIASNPEPPGGIDGLDIPVEAVLLSTTSTDVRVKVGNGSITTFPVTVENGDVITLYQQSSPDFGGDVATQIQVGTRVINPWTVITNSGPDYDASFTPPSNLNNQVPNTFVTSSPVAVSDINRPITITATNGALISIDFGTYTASPVTFDPSVNTSFRLGLLTSTSLDTPESTDVVVGTEAIDIPAVSFTWETRTYVVAPPPPSYRGVWYSKKSEKFDGYPIGTVLPVFKENIAVSYGNLSGENDSRYPGFVSCDGTEYPVTRFPHLWDVIGNTYGGDGEYDENTKQYSGVFKVPDYRNRRLAGTGFVDGNRSSSAGLPVDTVGKSIYDVGAEGGYWYFDKVNASGPNPLEQVIGTGNTGIESEFFTIGSIRMSGLETLTTEVVFDITGSVSAQVGPLTSVPVSTPEHDHFYLAAVVESERGDPLNPWEPEGRALFKIGTTEASLELGSEGPGDAGNLGGASSYSDSRARGYWEDFLNTTLGASFTDELAKYDPNWSNVSNFVNLLPVQSPPSPGNVVEINTEISFLTYWGSPDGVLNDAKNQGLLRRIDPNDDQATWNTDHRQLTAVIDTDPSNFSIDPYTPPTGQTYPHSHMITVDPVINPQTDYTAGNVPGPGIIGSEIGSGLGNANAQLQIVFSQDQTDNNPVFMDMTEGTFNFLANFKSPVPVAALRPQKQVPVINPFHKTKYVIKAY